LAASPEGPRLNADIEIGADAGRHIGQRVHALLRRLDELDHRRLHAGIHAHHLGRHGKLHLADAGGDHGGGETGGIHAATPYEQTLVGQTVRSICDWAAAFALASFWMRRSKALAASAAMPLTSEVCASV